tara:strand:+ start:99 stop:278 length:180 start_codon:yes stop_codon:yes gene_type:complete
MKTINKPLFSVNKAKVTQGAYGMIAINVSGKTILVNANGIFNDCGKHIRTSEAKDLLGI